MDTQTKRIELAKWILSTGEEMLERIDAIRQDSPKIVAHTLDGKPLTKAQYKKKILEAEARMDAGEFTSHEDLLKEMQNW